MLNRLIVILVVLACAAGGIWWLYDGKRQPSDLLTLYGNVDIRQVDVGFRVGGRVTDLFKEEGDAVKTGERLGVVLTRVHEIGAVVQGGQTVYTVTLNNPVWIRAYVTQPNLGNIRPGQEVLLSIDATPDKTYRGRIGFISPTAEFTPKTVETKEVRNDLVFRFRVIADDPDNVMRQGMPVTVTLRKDGGKP